MKVKQLDSHFIPYVNKGNSNGDKIMIVLHGLGDSLESYKVFSKEINVTGLSYLLINAPTPYFFGHSWYDIPPGDPRPGIDNSVMILTNIIKEVVDQGYELKDIILCGFSQGGCIVLETITQLSDQLCGAVALSPRIYYEQINSKINENVLKTPLFIAHGEHDPVIPVDQTKAGANLLRERGFETEFISYDMQHEIDPMEIADLRNWLNEIL